MTKGQRAVGTVWGRPWGSQWRGSRRARGPGGTLRPGWPPGASWWRAPPCPPSPWGRPPCSPADHTSRPSQNAAQVKCSITSSHHAFLKLKPGNKRVTVWQHTKNGTQKTNGAWRFYLTVQGLVEDLTTHRFTVQGLIDKLRLLIEASPTAHECFRQTPYVLQGVELRPSRELQAPAIRLPPGKSEGSSKIM